MDNNQLPEVNAEVKEEQVISVAEVEVIEDKEVDKKEEKKSNLSTILLILLFVGFFVYIMGMPYINSFISNLTNDNGLSQIEKDAKLEEEKQNQNKQENSTPVVDKEEVKLTEVVCTSSISNLENYQLVETQTFEINSTNQIINSSTTSNYTFIAINDFYNSLKKECEEDSLKYVNYDGYSRSCSFDNSSVIVSHLFELEIFKPITGENINIGANATYKQNIDEVKNILISKGYTCK